MHQLHPSGVGTSWSKFWTSLGLLGTALLTGFAATAALRGNIRWFFVLVGASFCISLLEDLIQLTGKWSLEGGTVQKIKFALSRSPLFETPEVSISDKTLRVGQEFIIMYQQCFNQPAHLSRFTISLVLRQELTQEANEGDRVDTAESVVKILERSHEDIPSGLFCAQKSFRIPEDGIRSFTNSLKWSAKHTGKWLVRLHMERADLPAFMNEFEIFVGPEGAKKGPRPLNDKGWRSDTRYSFADKSEQ